MQNLGDFLTQQTKTQIPFRPSVETQWPVSDIKGLIVGPPHPWEAKFFADAIKTSGEADLIGSEPGPKISSKVVRQWWESAQYVLIVRANGRTIAMGTVSTSEAPLPPDTIELCHVFVVPKYRRQYKGSHLIIELLNIVRQSAFRKVAARVVRSNRIGHLFLQSLRLTPMHMRILEDYKSFEWYEKCVE